MPIPSRVVLTSFVFALVSTVAFGADITGLYGCSGIGAEGAQYEGTVLIGRKGEAYTLEWTIARQKYTGIGILSDDTLSAMWTLRGTGKSGVSSYQVRENGQLMGKWVGTGGGKIHSEILTPAK